MWYPYLDTLYNLTYKFNHIYFGYILAQNSHWGEQYCCILCTEIHNGTGHLIERQIHDIESVQFTVLLVLLVTS